MKINEIVTIFRDKNKYSGILKKTNGPIAVVEIENKIYVGRIVNSWIEL